MSSDAKASTAGSNQRHARRLVLPAVVLALALALAVGSASGATTRFFQEVFGSTAEPSFSADRGLAFDQGSEELLVIDSTSDTLTRFNADGTASNFGALGSNAIDGEGTGDETPLGHLAFESNRQREQVAIDESGEVTDGNIYVTQSAKDVIDIFNAEGEYLGQLTESTGTGAFGEPCGVAVDAEGTVYVGDRGDDRIHVFDPAANPPVNADNTASFETVTDPCTLAAGTGATAGFLFVDASTGAQLRKVDAATGEVKYEIVSGASTVTVDPATGHVFVARNTGSSSTIDEYDASGASEATLVSSFKPGSTAEGVAANSAAEEVYVARSSTENVEVYGAAVVVPDVTTEAPSSNTGVRATLAGTVNPDGVELDECFFEWGEGSGTNTPYTDTAPCAETPAEIGAGTSPVAVHADLTGLTPQGTSYHYRLVAVNPNATINGANQNFTTPNTVTAEAATGLTPTAATLNGSVNPDTATISECVFEWGLPKEPGEAFQKYPETAPCVPGPGGISGESPVSVEADLSGLHPGTSYVYRLKATYPTGSIATAGLNLQTTGPVIEASWSEDVVFNDAVLKARINPEGSATTYRFEWGAGEAYGEETEELAVGSDSSVHQLSRALEGLTPGTTYHYRVIATNGVAENVGPDQTFATFAHEGPETDCPNQSYRGGPAAALPECRAYEMVSPLDKKGADVVPASDLNSYNWDTDIAARDGNKMTFSSYKPFGETVTFLWSTQLFATRSANGWNSHSITPAHQGEVSNVAGAGLISGSSVFTAFDDDLSTAFLHDGANPPLTPEAIPEYYNYYLFDTTSENLTTMSTQLFSPTNSRALGGSGFMGFSADGRHTVFSATAQLTADAKPGNVTQLYDYHDGELELVSVLPGGEAAGSEATMHSFNVAGQYPAGLRPIGKRVGETDHAISEDGSRIFWMNGGGGNAAGTLYARVEGATTIPVSESVPNGSDATYWTAAVDGSKVLFGTQAGGGVQSRLYRFDVDAETPTLIAEGVDANEGVLGASDDLAYVYFVSEEALAPGATAGEQNLYVDHEGAKTFIASLTSLDMGGVSGFYHVASNTNIAWDKFSQVTPDGRHLIFQSSAPLTGYDNTSLTDSEPAVEIYRYDALEDGLDCISCNPSGSRPLTRALTVPHYRSIEDTPYGLLGGSDIAGAAWLTTPRHGEHTPRMLADDGSYVFFNANDALVPQDTNGVQDVYEWREQGSGSCQRPGGCVHLISTGTDSVRSTFIDASEGGQDVFFRTHDNIDPEDPGLIDIYDARTGGGFPRPLPPPACVGDSCQSPPAAPNDATPASAGFRGAGDPKPTSARNCAVQVRRAAKLSRRAKALRRKARRAKAPMRTKRLRRRSARYAKRAKALSRRAARCRRAVRRASR